ncbi:MAG: methylated-DNA--[protein]-cysteine S-methyltransferase [Variibacter sp.]|nr:methylated-DNA--[protein]-cysteine S-methyltransferase [Variibacter sp.]
MTLAFTLFETSIGTCALAWGPRGIVAVGLPEGDEAATRARLLRRFPDARETPPPPPIRRVVEEIVRLLQGEAVDLSHAPLDMERIHAFPRSVYAIARTIAPGHTLTYGEIAARLGDPGLARAVGRALGENPFPIIVPCHRVLAANGKTGGFSAHGGVATKLRLLAIENARVGSEPTLFDLPRARPLAG